MHSDKSLPVPYRGAVPATPCDFYLGRVVGGPPFILREEQLATHLCVLGRTGSGKSKLLELWGRQMLVAGRGFTLIDPNGDLSEDLLAFIAYRKAAGDDFTWRRVHYVEPSYETVFGYDPFAFRPARPIPDGLGEAAYRAWLHTKVDRVGEVLQRKQNQAGFEGMPRLQRVLTDVLLAVGTAVNRSGRHLPLADALVLLDAGHPRHAQVWACVAPHLDAEIRAEFERWRVLNPDRRLTETESTINRLRSFLSPLVKAIFCDHVHTIDFRGVVQGGETLLVNLRETDYFSADQGKAIAGLFIHEVLTTAASTPREMRVPHTLIIDEAPDFIGADIGRALRQMRKFKLTVCLAGQNVTSFRKGDLDLVDTVVSQPGVLVSFEQRLEDDLDVLAPAIFRGNLDFEELYQVMDRPDGHDFLSMDEYAESFSRAESWSESVGQSRTHTTSRSRTRTVSQQASWSASTTQATTSGTTATSGTTHASTHGTSQGESPLVRAGSVAAMVPTAASSLSRGVTHQAGVSRSSGTAAGRGETLGGGSGRSDGTSQGEAHSTGQTLTRGRGGSSTQGTIVSHKTILIPKTREEFHPTGRLRHATEDQLHYFKCCLHALRGRQAAVKLPGVREGFFVEVADVAEKWRPEDKFTAIERMKRRLFDLRPYNVRPQVGDAAQDRRLAQFLGETPPVQPREFDDDEENPIA